MQRIYIKVLTTTGYLVYLYFYIFYTFYIFPSFFLSQVLYHKYELFYNQRVSNKQIVKTDTENVPKEKAMNSTDISSSNELLHICTHV